MVTNVEKEIVADVFLRMIEEGNYIVLQQIGQAEWRLTVDAHIQLHDEEAEALRLNGVAVA